jgi:hypothetical protein
MVECKYCGGYFKDKRGLKVHISCKHPEKGEYNCNYCNKSYDKKVSLHRHLRRKHQEQAFDIKCEECGNYFRTEKAQNIHFRSEHSSFSKLSDKELLQLLQRIEKEEGKVTQKIINRVDYTPHCAYYSKRFGTISKAKQKADLHDEGTIILTDDEYENLNSKLVNSELLQEIITGLLMGGGWISKDEGRNSIFGIEVINKEFLDWLDQKLGNISMGVVPIDRSGDEIIIDGKKVDKAKKSYALKTRNLEGFNKFNLWYSTGEKRFPEMDLTPMILKMWYVCDGSYTNYPVIYSTNENDRKDFVLSLFDDLPLDPNFNKGGGGCIQFKRPETDKFFNYLGESVPGFEYKWPK